MPMTIQPEYSPGAPGGVCFVCKSARRQGEQVVDFYVDPEGLNWVVPTSIPGMAFELATGSLEICQTCIAEAARGFGMVDADKGSRLAAENARLRNALEDAEERADLAEETVSQMRRYDEIKGLATKLFGPEA